VLVARNEGPMQLMSKMTKAQIVSTMAEETGLSKKDAASFFESFATLAYKEVKKNGECLVPGFGKLVKAKRKAREGRNPATGETIKIPAKTVVKFRLAKAVKDAVL
jgi:DNA-binding protein HU-beta